jgi:hypothetical protein
MKKLGIPPDPVEPSPTVIGAVKSLEAKNRQLILLNEFFDSVMEEVLDIPPDPYRPALEGVRDASQGIADMIQEVMDDWPPIYIPPQEFLDVIQTVKDSAQFLANNASYYIDQTIECTIRCLEHALETSCESADCFWISNGGTGYCCDESPW